MNTSRDDRYDGATSVPNEEPRDKEVFVSVGHFLSPDQAMFVQWVKDCLAEHGVQPVTIERQAQMSSDPIGTIRSAIEHTQATLVIAIERFRTGETIEFPGSSYAVERGSLRLATVWNQIEAAMSLQIGRPVLVLVEDGITFQGVIDPTIHSVVQFTLREPRDQLSDAVHDALEHWLRAL